MVESWDRAFAAELGKSERNVVFELRDWRNRWAHNDAFTVDDAYRTLDSIERLLVAADAREATEVGAAKSELMRLKFEAEARKATPTAEALLTQPAAGLKPWRDVIQPHDDVARGRFALAEFAADLHQVWHGAGAAEYADPVEFFRRTFLTGGLRQLLSQAVERLTGQGGSPVVDLQTSFGGGKTHSMIALYHLCSGTPLAALPQEVQDLVGEREPVRAAAGAPGGARGPPHPARAAVGEGRRHGGAAPSGASWPGSSAARRLRPGGRRRPHEHESRRRPAPGARAGRALPHPHRRMGGLRPGAVPRRHPAGGHLRHPLHLRPDAHRGGPRRGAGAARRVDPGLEAPDGPRSWARTSRSAAPAGGRRCAGCGR